ncbi:unnamed protein product [Amoebophrya sp. A120]|nr:unnamed protein product [Amoebophrya sp. A120]|eukprot:GSA120T00002967001.1
MAFSLRGPLYQWPTGRTDRVTYDRLWDRALHFPDDQFGFYSVDLATGTSSSSTSPFGAPGDQPAVIARKADGVEKEYISLVPITEDSNLEVVADAKFAPDDQHIAYVIGHQVYVTNRNDIANRAQPMALTQKWSTESHYEVLSFFWSPTASSLELIAVSTCGIEIFKVKSNIKSARTYQTLARRVWVEPKVGLMVCCIGARTLQPFDLRPKRTPQKLPKFDLYIGKSKAIEHFDVNVLTLYGETYCVHLDVLHGKVSLRNISDARKSTPENDIVLSVMPYTTIDLVTAEGTVPGQASYFLGDKLQDPAPEGGIVSEPTRPPNAEEKSNILAVAAANSPDDSNQFPSDTARGPLRISVVEDLLVVHRVDRGWSWVFDVRLPQSQAVGFFRSFDAAFEYLSSDVVIDRPKGSVYKLQVDVWKVMRFFEQNYSLCKSQFLHLSLEESMLREQQYLLSSAHHMRAPATSYEEYLRQVAASGSRKRERDGGPSDESDYLSTYLLQLVLRRPRSRARAVFLLERALENRLSLEEWAHNFAALNLSYRGAIEQSAAAAKQEAATASKQAAQQAVNAGGEGSSGGAGKNGDSKSSENKGGASSAAENTAASGSEDPAGGGASSTVAAQQKKDKTVSLSTLTSQLQGKTILSEKDVVLEVFMPFFHRCYGSSAEFFVELPLDHDASAEAHSTIPGDGTPANGTPANTTTGASATTSAGKTKERRSSSTSTSAAWRASYQLEPRNVRPLPEVYVRGKPESCPGVPCLRWSRPSSELHRRDFYYSTPEAAPSPLTDPNGASFAPQPRTMKKTMNNTAPPLMSAVPIPGNAPYLLQVALSYLNSLLNLQILPHRILQCFLFDLCVYFEQFHLLQQLLHYHVLLDNPDLCRRLVSLVLQSTTASTSSPYPTHAMLLHDHDSVAPFAASPNKVDNNPASTSTCSASSPYASLIRACLISEEVLSSDQLSSSRKDTTPPPADSKSTASPDTTAQHGINVVGSSGAGSSSTGLFLLLPNLRATASSGSLKNYATEQQGTASCENNPYSPAVLQYLEGLRRNRQWLTQSALDMALRFRDFFTVADCLVLSEQFVDAIFLIKQTQLATYPLAHLLERVFQRILAHLARELAAEPETAEEEQDFVALLEKLCAALVEVEDGGESRVLLKENGEKCRSPDLFRYVGVWRSCLREIYLWQQQATSATDEEPLLPPNISGCEVFGLVAAN